MLTKGSRSIVFLAKKTDVGVEAIGYECSVKLARMIF